VIWDEELLHDFEPPAVLSEVIWDEEMSTKPDMESELLQLLASGDGHKVCDENWTGQEGLDELTYVEVIWDEEPVDTETVVGEDWVYAEQKQLPMQASVGWDIATQEVFDCRSVPSVIWDEEMLEQETQPPVDLWRKSTYCTSLPGSVLGKAMLRAKAFEEARAMGVMRYEVESSSYIGGRSTHEVIVSF
jgi:hypothetical protein